MPRWGYSDSPYAPIDVREDIATSNLKHLDIWFRRLPLDQRRACSITQMNAYIEEQRKYADDPSIHWIFRGYAIIPDREFRKFIELKWEAFEWTFEDGIEKPPEPTRPTEDELMQQAEAYYNQRQITRNPPWGHDADAILREESNPNGFPIVSDADD